MINVRNIFDQPVKNNLATYDNNRKIAISQRDEYTTGCLFDYNYFNNYKQIIAADLSKQQKLDADPKAIQQINFTGNLNRSEDANDNRTMFFIIEEPKETISGCQWVTVKVL